MKSTTAGCVALALALAGPARAQTGLFVGAHWIAETVIFKPGGTWDCGPLGTSLQAGMMLGKNIGILVRNDRDHAGSARFVQRDVLGRVRLLGSGRSRLYVTGGVTDRKWTSGLFDRKAGVYDFSGVSPSVGWVWQVFLMSKLSVEAGNLWTFGSFSDTHAYASSVSGTGSRFTIGASYYLLGGK